MNKLILPTLMIALASTSAWAKNGHQDKAQWAKVTHVEPISQSIEHRVPTENCWNEQVRYQQYSDGRRSYTETIIGGIIGGAIGNEIGHNKSNKKVGSVIGAVLGASIGNDMSNRNYPDSNSRASYRNRRHCEITHQVSYEQEVIGYHVWYRYRGSEYQTTMDHHPGNKIRVRVSVSPY